MQGYVTALFQAARNQMYTHQEFCYLIEGVLYTTSKEDTGKPKVGDLRRETSQHILLDTVRGFYWKGTDRPYFA